MVHLKPLVAEIHELGRVLALLIGPGSTVERARRSEVRVLLREAFLAAQDASDEVVLCDVRDRLARARDEITGLPPEVEIAEPAPVEETADGDANEEDLSSSAPEEPADQNDEPMKDENANDLADRLVRHRRFGALDHAVGHGNADFSPVGQSKADGLASGIEKRVLRVLNHLAEDVAEGEDDGSPRKLKTQEENKELIVSKLS